MEDQKQKVMEAIYRHMNDLSKEELIMVLNFIFSLKDFR